MTKKLSTFILLIVLSSGCGRSEVAQNPLPGAAAPEPSSYVAGRPALVVREGGWQIPGLKDSKVVKRTESPGNGGGKITATWLVPRKEVIIGDEFMTPAERRELGLMRETLVVRDIYRYEVGQRTYGYLVSAYLKGYGATYNLQFLDEDGDGLFEGVGHASRLRIAPPHWAQ